MFGPFLTAPPPLLCLTSANLKCCHTRAYKSLSPKARAGVGLGIIAWGTVGLYLSDKAEEKFGYTPTEKDKEDLRNLAPHITTVERGER